MPTLCTRIYRDTCNGNAAFPNSETLALTQLRLKMAEKHEPETCKIRRLKTPEPSRTIRHLLLDMYFSSQLCHERIISLVSPATRLFGLMVV
jgi:hypothetical protein